MNPFGQCVLLDAHVKPHRHTLGTNVDSGASIFLLYISAQISYPPSIHKFLCKSTHWGISFLEGKEKKKKPKELTEAHQQPQPRPLPRSQSAGQSTCRRRFFPAGDAVPTGRYKSSLIPRRMPTCVLQARRSRSEMNPKEKKKPRRICT